jgi:hypothetical protein
MYSLAMVATPDNPDASATTGQTSATIARLMVFFTAMPYAQLHSRQLNLFARRIYPPTQAGAFAAAAATMQADNNDER